MCRKARDTSVTTLREVAKILGNLAWAIQAIPFAQGHYRCVQRQYLEELSRTDGDLSKRLQLNRESLSDLDWWVNNVERVNGRPLSTQEPDLIIFSDASLSGWGAVLNDVTAKGPWSEHDRDRDINEFELLVALYALKSLQAWRLAFQSV